MFLTTTRRAAQSAPDVYSNLHRLSRMMDEALGEWNGDAGVGMDALVRRVRGQGEPSHRGRASRGAPEDVKLSLENQASTIQGEKKQVAEEKSEWHRHERSYGRFRADVHPPAAWIRTGSTPRWSMGS